jgi:hypothetical protein
VSEYFVSPISDVVCHLEPSFSDFFYLSFQFHGVIPFTIFYQRHFLFLLHMHAILTLYFLVPRFFYLNSFSDFLILYAAIHFNLKRGFRICSVSIWVRLSLLLAVTQCPAWYSSVCYVPLFAVLITYFTLSRTFRSFCGEIAMCPRSNRSIFFILFPRWGHLFCLFCGRRFPTRFMPVIKSSRYSYSCVLPPKDVLCGGILGSHGDGYEDG